jgi:hypothetical protein
MILLALTKIGSQERRRTDAAGDGRGRPADQGGAGAGPAPEEGGEP